MSSSEQLPHPPIHEAFRLDSVAPVSMDLLWARGWRHFGTHFYRYNYYTFQGELHQIIALRTNLGAFRLSKSQRRIVRKNSDLRVIVQPVTLDEQKWAMFYKHRDRFEEYVPDSLHNFLSEQPATVPCACMEVGVYDSADNLLAVSFLDVGATSTSSVYAMFDPDYSDRSLGIYTMLLEIEYSQKTNKLFYYSGYATVGSSAYDYKKCFHGLSRFDFYSNWTPLDRQCS